MQVIVDKHTVTLVKNEIVNEGEYNVQSCNFQFSSDYDGLPKIAIFKTGTVTKQIMLSGNTCITPEEVLQTTGIVGLGVYAYQTDGDNLTLRYSPTPAVFTVEPGSYDEGDAPTPPTPSVIEQLQEEITQNANNITSLENVTDTHTIQIGTLQTDVNNIKTEQITQNTNIQTNANDISNIKAEQISQNNNIQANADDITTLQNNLSNEITNRENSDINLQQQIDAITSSSDIVDIVGTYAQLMAYDTQHLSNNDVIKVLQDETHENAMTYYRWNKHNSQWVYIGQEAPYYTKSETDTLLQGKANINDVYTKSQIDDTLEDYALKTDLTDFITEQEVDTKLEDYVETTTYTQGQATQDTNIQNNTDSIEDIELLIEQMPTVSGQGTDISLQNVYNYRLIKFLPQGNSSQVGNPTPTTHIPVKTVTGENSLVICNENLFNKNTITPNSYLDSDGNIITSTTWSISDYIPVIAGEDYVYKWLTTVGNAPMSCYYDENKNFVSSFKQTTYATKITIPSNVKFVRFTIETKNTDDLNTFMFAKGSTAPTTYVEHEEQNYSLSFGNMEFNSTPDGTIKDGIVGTPDNWYKREYIGKLVLDGVNNAFSTKSGTNFNKLFITNEISNIKVPSSNYNLGKLLSSHFEIKTAQNLYSTDLIGAGVRVDNKISFGFGVSSDLTTLALANQWLQSNNVTNYYEHLTPTDIPITDTTLIGQLNNIYNNAHSYNDVTNITTTYESGNEQMYLDVEALAKGGSTTTETDPIFSASASSGITSSDITNWNGKASTTYVDTAISNAITNTLGGSF